jgi:cobalt-zinc-cadmium efflux system outer membrane protein
MIYRVTGLLLLFTVLFGSTFGQQTDSVIISLPAAEKLFLQRNLDLLAQQYNTDIRKALVSQAGYWDNPVLNTDQNIYDGKFFRHNKDFGQVLVQLQQVIKTAGKRNKLVALANDDVLSSQQQFADMMRNLRFVLRSDYHTLRTLFAQRSLFKTQLASLEKLAAAMDAQLQAGNISQKDNIRVKALLYNLRSELAALDQQVTDTEKEFSVLLQVTGDTVFIPATASPVSIPADLSLGALMDSARANRPDLQLAQTNLLSKQHNLNYQKALAVPDLTIGTEYDQRSSYVNNFWGLGISVPLPLFNKNKGNIAAAKIGVQQAGVQVQQAQNQVQQDIIAAYRKLLIMRSLQASLSTGFMDKYDQLLKNMVDSYQQRQVSLLEFIDFFDAYKESAGRQLEQQSQLSAAAEELNYATGTNIISQD